MVKPLENQTVMIVDDEMELRDILASVIASKGALVVQAENGIDALEKLQNFNIDVVVSDIRMPRLDGLGLLKAINALAGHKPPVVLISGYSDMTTDGAQALGAVALLQKPFEWEQLIDLLQAMKIEQKQSS